MTSSEYKTALEAADAECDAKYAPIDAAYRAYLASFHRTSYGTVDDQYWADHEQVTAAYYAKIGALSARFNRAAATLAEAK